jgi:SAM-dependent methyltransferase
MSRATAAHLRHDDPTFGPGDAYPLGHDERELQRLTLQARMFEPITRRLFEAAGLSVGMRVLDVGSGAGDVAFLARQLVGRSGEVVGVERSPAAVATARARARIRRYENVEFIEGDIRQVALASNFDAVVGRLVLMYVPDPSAVVRHVAEHTRRGGLIVFQEFDTYGSRAVPPAPTYDRVITLMRQALRAAGSDTELGLKLKGVFSDAGLPTPDFRFESLVAGAAAHPAYHIVTEVTRSLLPVIERCGLASASELDLDTLADRMQEEVTARNGVIVSPALVGAWTRTP